MAGGWFVSFNGTVTFREWTDEALLRFVPDERLLVESDSSSLAPVPRRGKRNEAGPGALAVARLAMARGNDAATIGALTVQNARRLFNLG